MSTILVSTPSPYVRLIRFNRSEARNSLSRALLRETAAVLEEASASEDVRAVVLTGDDRAFSAGADIKEMPDGGIPMWGQADRLKAWKTIERFPKPLIAAVNGFALGGGCELTTLCDIVIAAETASFALPEVKIGAFPGDGGTQRVPRIIGKSRAMWMMMTGTFIDGAKACDWGLATEVVPADRTVGRAIEIAREIAEMSPIAVGMIKEEVLMTYQKPLDESLSLERKLLLWQTEDHDEGIMAFTEKRKPVFRGR
ncbi:MULTISPECIES: enoyl-CoA hydratase-related protein [unclassified Aurantimonas]|uniref:enoyl-CoA hydratase-related protein n=1 Tax=unclassified Aurantimonas TaxID=2638230 RepID=UPI002E18E45D|nr:MULTISPECIES: enoyl-CoA hydratase-related protein [unclassified Aurantimonas]MEC5292808.1 enoyl-CoA hydratase-related protein [Aurantimonas sp. C2-3-R2]MEC5413860.1 enoyl-CoA hydratase-related protein [Aurantimonas sp. C2-4-R8]